jgi:hypothetical protein
MPADAELAELAGVGRDVGMPVGRVDVGHPDHDEGHDDDQLHHDHDVVELHRFARATDQEAGDDHHDYGGRHVGDGRAGRSVGPHDPLAGRRQKFGRQPHAHLHQQAVEIGRPTAGDGAYAHGIFQDQVPADHPGGKLAQRRVSVGVCRALHRQQSRKLGIAQADQATGDRCKHEGDGERGPRIERGRRAGEHEDAGADDGADAHGGDAERAQHLGQGFERAAFDSNDVGNRLAREDALVVHPLLPRDHLRRIAAGLPSGLWRTCGQCPSGCTTFVMQHLVHDHVQSAFMPGATSNPNTAQPKSPMNPSAAEAAAKAELEKRGYTGVKSLTRDPAGNWAAKAMKNNVEIAVILEPSGTIREQ